MQPKHQWTLAGAVTTLSVLVGLWMSLDPWPKFFWETPNNHTHDILMVEGKILAEIENTKTAMQVFRDEWKCSQWSNELTLLYDQVNSGNTSRRLQDNIEDLRDRMDERTCVRFGRY